MKNSNLLLTKSFENSGKSGRIVLNPVGEESKEIPFTLIAKIDDSNVTYVVNGQRGKFTVSTSTVKDINFN